MIVKISITNSCKVLKSSETEIIVKVPFYSAFGTVAYICATEGSTLEDYEASENFKGKTLFVGLHGGLSLEP